MSDDVDRWQAWDALASVDPASLSRDQRLLLAFGELRNAVNMDGFHLMMSTTAGDLVPDAIGAARATGMDELAEVVGRAVAVLGAPYPVDRDIRQQKLEALPESDLDNLNRLDDEYYALERRTDLDAAMRSLVRLPD